MKLKLDQIRANSWNCNFMDAQERESLKQHMLEAGPEKALPVVVRLMSDGGYELVDGEHRWIIAGELGWETMEVVVREADDLQARVFCVSYNKLRGRFNWLKLYDVLKKDLDEGVNLEEAYKGVLTAKELKWLLALGNLIPPARLTLEDSLKKYPEFTLEQLYLISKFPANQQESLSETYKNPLATHLLSRLLSTFPQKPPPPPSSPKDFRPYAPDGIQQNQAHYLPEKTGHSNSNIANQDSSAPMEQTKEVADDDVLLNSSRSSFSGFESEGMVSQVDASDKGRVYRGVRRGQYALLLSVGFTCDCGRLHQANFKKLTIVVQKENLLFEHVDFLVHTFLVHCDNCDNDHEVTVNNLEAETGVVSIFCCRCSPNRRGLLDVNTLEVTWF
ncbi:MAG: ParB/RepB/Spo0J family partition protein [Nitrososphaerota archaeon]|jgi:hypothetical protein|nr:ParB/RepB/Spo0J family partition protein [Nitrososphaerota archaeon]